MKNTITVSWFSAGVSSAVATWMMRGKLDHIIYCHIDDQQEDTLRFVEDCKALFGGMETMQSPLKSVNNACRSCAYVNGPRGAACTRLLKKRVRKEWECNHEWFCRFRYVWGLDASETKRADQLRASMPECEHIFPLIDNGISKEESHGILHKHGIKRPAMYDLGYHNNNCVGCVKGGMGYWNRIRRDFPAVFQARSEMERIIGHSCIKGIFLDELDPEAGRDEGPIVAECGVACELLANSL